MSELETYINALRRIIEVSKAPYYSRTQREARKIAKEALAQWGRKE